MDDEKQRLYTVGEGSTYPAATEYIKDNHGVEISQRTLYEWARTGRIFPVRRGYGHAPLVSGEQLDQAVQNRPPIGRPWREHARQMGERIMGLDDWQFVDMSEQQATAASLRYGLVDGRVRSITTVAREMGVKRQRVYQLLERALELWGLDGTP